MARVTEGRIGTGRRGALPTGFAFTAFAAYRAVNTPASLPVEARPAISASALRTLASAPRVMLRGTYDTWGYRYDTHILIWLVAPAPDPLQNALAAFGRTPLAGALEPSWTAIGVRHDRDWPAWDEPAYFTGQPALRYLCVSPVVRKAAWYSLALADQRRLTTESLQVARRYPDVQRSRATAVGLPEGDGLLALESDELVRIMELIRELKLAPEGRYVGNELPFITGVRRPLAEILDALP